MILGLVLSFTKLRRSRDYPPDRPGSCVPFGLAQGVSSGAITVVFPSATRRVGCNQDIRTECHG